MISRITFFNSFLFLDLVLFWFASLIILMYLITEVFNLSGTIFFITAFVHGFVYSFLSRMIYNKWKYKTEVNKYD